MAFTVKNTGKLDGDEVAQVYFRHVSSAVPQPKLALCGFTRVQLKHGESSQVTVEVPAATLALLGHAEEAIRRGTRRL